MASCKPPRPTPKSCLPPTCPHPSTHLPYAVTSASPTPPSPSDPSRKHPAHFSPSESYPQRTWSCPRTTVSMTTHREEPVATGSLIFYFFLSSLLPLPHPSPAPLNWVKEGRRPGGGERGHPLIASLPIFFFISSFRCFWRTQKSFHFFATAAHTILVSSPTPPILAIYHYEMEWVFNLSDVTES